MPPTKPMLACVRCSERKVKCDKQSPCNTCVRHNVQCDFRQPRPSQRRRKCANDELMIERIKHYESLLLQSGIDPNQIKNTSEADRHPKSSHPAPKPFSQLPTVSTVPAPHAAHFESQLLHGSTGTALADNSLWLRVVEEIYDSGDETEEEDAEDPASEIGASNDDFAHILGCRTPNSVPLHPSVEIIHQLWQIFIENVNPLTKLVHIPSLQVAIEKAINNIESIPRGFEALMFAIYSIAVRSLGEDECRVRLGETRSILLLRYVAATKAALMRARFMSSTSIVVLQALMLHIFCIRDTYEPRALWVLTGIANRIAEGMGMHIDGSVLGLSPFETEIRRRIWWQLRVHDIRAAELSGQAKLRDLDIDETTPKQPGNINDSDLYPSMTQPAVETTRGATEMIWCMLRTELAWFAASQKARLRKQGKAAFASEELAVMKVDVKVAEALFKELEDLIETRYLRFCDPSQPLQLMAMLGGRITTSVMGFVFHHPRRWAEMDQVPASERQLLWRIVIQLLEQYNMMQSSPQLRGFKWVVPYLIQWHVAIHVLDTLRVEPLHVDAEKTWGLIGALYENNSEMLLTMNKPIFVALGNLCLEAFNARAAALAKEKHSVASPPEYITKLGDLRVAAKARREAVAARRSGQSALDSGKTLTTAGNLATWTDPNPVQGNTWTDDDTFWLGKNPDGGGVFGTGAGNTLMLDADTILDLDFGLDTQEGETIDWAQWDAWLGDLNPIRGNTGAKPF